MYVCVCLQLTNGLASWQAGRLAWSLVLEKKNFRCQRLGRYVRAIVFIFENISRCHQMKRVEQMKIMYK